MTEKAKILSREEKAHGIVRNYIYASMGIGLIPIPIVDFAAISLTQLKMLRELAVHYEVNFSKDIGKSVIASLVGGVLPAPLGLGLASLTKAIPVIGPLVGSAGVSFFAGASTYALSRVFIQHFEAGGTFLNFDPEVVREYFANEFENGKEAVKEMKGNQKETA